MLVQKSEIEIGIFVDNCNSREADIVECPEISRGKTSKDADRTHQVKLIDFMETLWSIASFLQFTTAMPMI